MRGLFPGGLAVLFVVLLPPVVSKNQVNTPIPPVTRYEPDSRLERLRSFFNKTSSPAREYARTFLEAADIYELDWRLLPSLSWVESEGGKTARNNNLFGWDCGRAQFATPIAAIHMVGYRLTHSLLYRDKDIDGILSTYNSDPDWAVRVKAVMRQIAPSE